MVKMPDFRGRPQWSDVDEFFRGGLREQVQKILVFPKYTQAVISAARDLDVRMVLGIGDMFNPPEMGYGNVYRYLKWRKDKEQKFDDPLNRARDDAYELFEREKDRIRPYFTERGYSLRDYDIVVVIDGNGDSKAGREKQIEDRVRHYASLEQSIRDLTEGEKMPSGEDVARAFGGVDLYEQCVYAQSEFNRLLKRQIDVVKGFNGGLKHRFVRRIANNPAGLKMSTQPELELELVDVQPLLKEQILKSGTRRWIAVIGVKNELSEPELDIFERRNSAVVYERNVMEDLRSALQEYRSISIDGQPRTLPEQIEQVFIPCVEKIKTIDLGNGTNEKAEESIGIAKSLISSV